MTNASSRLAGTVMHHKPGRRAWGCTVCCKDKKKPTDTFYNNATRMECKQCGSKPNTRCLLFGDGDGGTREKWKKDNGVPPVSPAPKSPSTRPPAQQAANDKRAADKLKKECEDLRKKVKVLEAGMDDADDDAPSGPQAAIGQALKTKN